MRVIACENNRFVLNPNEDEVNTLKQLADQLNIKPETIIEWIVSYELLKYYQEISY